jgi:hypothetical protein
MHRLIGEVHPGIASAIRFVDLSDPFGASRLEAERRTEARRQALEAGA